MKSGLFLALAACLWMGCQSPPPTAGPVTTATLDSLRQVYRVPGVQVCRFRQDRVLGRLASGLRDMRHEAPVTDHTRFEAASLSKPVFAYLLTRLAEAGHLPPDWLRRPLCEWIDTDQPFAPAREPRYRGLDQYLSFRPDYSRTPFCQMTAQQLLTHQSGMGDWWDAQPTRRFAPGCRFRYSDDGYLLLQRVVEAHLDTPLQALLQQHLPDFLAAMRSFSAATLRGAVAHGHQTEGQYQRDIWRSQEALAHGTLLCSAQAYAAFMQHLSREQRFPPQRDMARVAEGLYWARGWGVDCSSPDTVYWHWGNDTYFQHFACYAPQRDLGLVIMTNSQNGLKLIEALFPRLWGEPIEAVHWCQ